MTVKKIVDNTPGAGVSHRQCEGAFSFPDQEEAHDASFWEDFWPCLLAFLMPIAIGAFVIWLLFKVIL